MGNEANKATPATATMLKDEIVYSVENKPIGLMGLGRRLFGELRDDDFFYFTVQNHKIPGVKGGKKFEEVVCRLPINKGIIKIER